MFELTFPKGYTFPFPTTGGAIDARDKQSMGLPYPPLRNAIPLGNHPMLAANSRAARGFRVRLGELRRVASHPRQRLTVR
jgi:hypothetical protein